MKKTLWLLIAARDNPDVLAVAPTLAWLADNSGAEFEMYLEDQRDGRLFARSGSTVPGGRHFEQFNYLHAAFTVKAILLGDTTLFRSSLALFGAETLASADNARDLYAAIGLPPGTPTVVVPTTPPVPGAPDLRPYFYPEVFFRKAAGLPGGPCPVGDYRASTVSLAERWIDQARGVAFGDPDAIVSMLATLCREKRVAIYGPVQHLAPQDVTANAYAEDCSSAAADASRLAVATGNRVLIGRQTGDGDLFVWSRDGVAIQIMDPNRPAFPVVARVTHRWHNTTDTVFDHEPDDAQLVCWADEGRMLGALLVHSGEMAHNEAMVNLVELCMLTGLKLGIGVHAARYETCPQLWELISVPRPRGGALGLVEPVLHCGGMGVLTENTCPAAALGAHGHEALQRIAAIAGDAWRPRGHLAFMDSDMASFTRTTPAAYAAAASCGLTYTISAAQPGRNRILHQDDAHIVLNQGSRSICTGSPYVRVTGVEDLDEKTPGPSPGWWLGVTDAPVVAFNSYIWRKGSAFMRLVDLLTAGKRVINVTPHVVARYARILQHRGLVPACQHGETGTSKHGEP